MRAIIRILCFISSVIIMKHRFLILFFLIGFSSIIRGQNSMPDSLALLFHNQLSVFPQEKIYLHTDKPIYITGEKLWFRAHLVNAASHVPFPLSRYVYVELFNPLDSLLSRVKIRNANNAYYGYIDIPQDIPEGDYMLRAYTNFMLSLDEHYLCMKTVRIGNPDNRTVRVEAGFSFDADGTTNADFSFSGSVNERPAVPRNVQISINGGRMQPLEVDADGAVGVSFSMPADASKRVMLLEADNTRQFIQIPVAAGDFDVGFYPEGGSLLQGIGSRIAFKALNSDGSVANVEGAVYDNWGNEILQFKTDHSGMGSFMLFPEEGKSYYVACTNDSRQSKRFELPAALSTGYAISVNNLQKDRIHVSVLKTIPDNSRDTLYLLAHVRGTVCYVAQWDAGRDFISLPKNQFPSGVLHLILFDAKLNPVSERLAFIHKDDDQVHVSFRSDMEAFVPRSPVNSRVTLTDSDGNPLQGSFSVSVTDDHAVTPDTAANILTHLLLTSDLRGHIDNPSAYFGDDIPSAWALDLLMLTQGWRRYDVASVAQGQFARPSAALELGPEISGSVRRAFVNRNLAKSKVSIVSANGEYFDLSETDGDGRFSFNVGEQPDSTTFIVQAITRSGFSNVELLIDGETFPERTLSIPVPAATVKSKEIFEQYIESAAAPNSEYRRADDWDLGDLMEVTVTARRPVPKSVFRASYHIDEERLQRYSTDRGILSVLEEAFPAVSLMRDERTGQEMVFYNGIIVRSLIIDDQINTPLKFDSNPISITETGIDIITGMQIDITSIRDISSMSNTFSLINAEKVKDIYISDVFSAFSFYPMTDIIIICESVHNIFYRAPELDIKRIRPLGYQQPVEFYSSKYDTPEKRNAQIPDLRTTIHWQPTVQTDSLGTATFGFYTADVENSYTAVIEGITTDGRIIRQESRLWHREDNPDPILLDCFAGYR